MGKSAVSVSHRAQRLSNAPVTVSYGKGRVSLDLPQQSFGSAEVSLFTVSGKRILRGAVSAANASGANISRTNIAEGVYLLSVKGIDGNTFSTRMTHSGGKLGIGITFSGAGAVGAPLAKSAAEYGAWRVLARATGSGYSDTSYTFEPTKGANVRHEITLRQSSGGGSVNYGDIGCTREGLGNAVKYFLAAMNAGDYTIMPLTSNAKYIENDNSASYSDKTVQFGQGLWKTPIQYDHHMNLIDTGECATFTELIAAKNDPQYLNGVRLRVTGDKISEVYVIVTVEGDWLFNAENYLRYSTAEDWSELPTVQRLPRERLISDARSYFEYFNDKTATAAWGVPCARLEGGAYTGNNSNSTCNVGVPDNVNININSFKYLVDTNHGMVVIFFFFGGADSHLFRILPTGFRYIHTLTAMKQSSFQGAPPE
jgi:hypothetical protein